MKYTITLTEKQIKVVNAALEDYFRQRLGQFFELPDDLAFDGYDYDQPDNVEFNKRIAKRDAGKELMEAAYRLMCPDIYLNKTSDMLICEDMWRVLRHFLFSQMPEEEREKLKWSCDADVPLHCSNEPMIKVEVKQK